MKPVPRRSLTAPALVALSTLLLPLHAAGAPEPTGGERMPATAADAASDPIAEFTRTMRSREGFIPVHYDPESGKVFLELERLNEDLLYVTSLATGLGSARAFSLDRGSNSSQGVVRFERHGPRVVLVRQNTDFVAISESAIERQRVAESFPVSVLASFPIAEQSGGRLLIDATDLILSDVWGIQGAVRNAGLGDLRLDRNRSYVLTERVAAFPGNTEVRSVLTFASENPSAEIRRHAPDGRSVTFQQHHSFVKLPDQPLAVRHYDPRTANSASTVANYAENFDEDYRVRTVARWRLVPRDTAAYLRGELSEPVEPIVYYVDPATPEPYRSAYFEGTLWWNDLLESAGFRNALHVRMLPEDADPMDVRYSVIQHTHRGDAGPSTGGGVRDPRTGEVIVAMPRMDTHRSLTDYNIYAGLLPAFAAQGIQPQLSAEEFTMARRRQLAAHEVGHTLGFPHNWLGAADNRSSVMDYPFPLIQLDGNGRLDISDAYRNGAGYSDSVAIRYAYTWFPNAEAEAAGLKAIVDEALARGHRFVTGGHGSLEASYPEATRWVVGRNMFEALERTVAVRRELIRHFDERSIRPGEPMAWLNPRFAHVYLHHRYSVEGVVKNIGGMQYTYALAGDGQRPTTIIPAAEQRRALDMILQVLSPEEIAIPERIARMIPPFPSGFEEPRPFYDPAQGVALPPAVGPYATWIETPAGEAFDPYAVARSFAQEVVDNVLHPERMARVAAFSAGDADQLSLDELLRRLVDGTWGAGGTRAGSTGAYRRATERAVLDGLFSLATDRRATAETRDAAERHLGLLRTRLQSATGGGVQDQAHRERAAREIELYLTQGIVPDLRTGVFPMPLPWP